MDEARLLEVLDDVVVAVRAALDELEDWGPSGARPGQYRLDVAADDAALPILHGAGLAVLSEESGLTGDGPSGLLAVIDRPSRWAPPRRVAAYRVPMSWFTTRPTSGPWASTTQMLVE